MNKYPIQEERSGSAKTDAANQYRVNEFPEIQAIVSSGYLSFPFMSCLLFHLESPQEAVPVLRQIQGQVSFHDQTSKESDRRLNLALTWSGLLRLNEDVAQKEARLFKREFREGMVTAHRQKILGDAAGTPSAPENWLWGAPQEQNGNQEVDLAIMIYEQTAHKREQRVGELMETPGMVLVDNGRIDSVKLKNHKEHFGFRDGISQPWMLGLNRPGAAVDEVAWGEIMIGYQDNLGTTERHPEIAVNGSYLVIRQIEQDVEKFWKSFDASDGDAIKLAAKQMGRWPDGTPVTLNPEESEDNPTNDFDFERDQPGLGCPVGAHIRRCNPRNGESRHLGKKDRHRILRRGRPYGTAAPAEHFPARLQPDVSVADGEADESRGLLFMCLNANFERQFEFMQHNWINDAMGALADELDPVASQLDFEKFTMPATPFRARCARGSAAVKTVGGGYFFLPSRTALATILKEAEA